MHEMSLYGTALIVRVHIVFLTGTHVVTSKVFQTGFLTLDILILFVCRLGVLKLPYFSLEVQVGPASGFRSLF
jgi:hypothetical protein